MAPWRLTIFTTHQHLVVAPTFVVETKAGPAAVHILRNLDGSPEEDRGFSKGTGFGFGRVEGFCFLVRGFGGQELEFGEVFG